MTRPLDIAIVGMGGVFPAARDLDHFWQNIVARHDAAKDAPPGRWVIDPTQVLSATVQSDRVYSKRACFIEDLPDSVPAGIDLDPDVYRALDPLYQIVLCAGRQAFDDRAVLAIPRQRIGVILAAIALPTDGASRWAAEHSIRFPNASLDARNAQKGGHDAPAFPRSAQPTVLDPKSEIASALSSRVTALPASLLARALNLGAGGYTLDAACASSLYAIKLACDELLSGRVDAMLAGGVSRPDSLYTQMGFSQLRALSPSGRCSPFDERADGLLVGEGAGVFLLKRVEDALRDGDLIYGVIRGIGLSNDIGGSLLAPDSEGQLRAMRAAYEQAGWKPHDVQLIECHGTGTPLGDAAEMRALRSLWSEVGWRSESCAIGSVKSNIGHLLTAAGAAGLAKVLLAMRHRTLPPSANFERASPSMPLDGGPFRVQTPAEPWMPAADGSFRAAISAFGFGGINAHLLLEFAPAAIQTAADLGNDARRLADGSSADSAPAPEQDSSVETDLSQSKIQNPKSKSEPPIAIIGMAATFGAAKSLDEFELLNRATRSAPDSVNLPSSRESATLTSSPCVDATSTLLDSISIPTGRFRVPPAELSEILPQQLLLLSVAADAMENAGQPLRQRRPRAGVFAGSSFDFGATNYYLRWRQIASANSRNPVVPSVHADLPPLNPARTVGALGNIIASRVAREFEFGGPSFAVSSEECSGLEALAIAMRALADGSLDLALVGAVDLCGDPRERSSRAALRRAWGELTPGAHSPPAASHPAGEGAAAIVLKRLDDALRDGDRVCAVIREPPIRTAAALPALSKTVDLMEHCSPSVALDAAGFASSPCPGAASSSIPALGEVAELVGHVGAAAGLASLIKTALCLENRLIPASHAAANDSRTSAADGVHLPRSPAYWFRNRADGPRRAVVCSSSIDGIHTSVLLEEFEPPASLESAGRTKTIQRRYTHFRSMPGAQLFAIEGNSPALILRSLDGLESVANGRNEIAEIFAAWESRRENHPEAALAATIIAVDRRELLDSISRLRQSLRHRPCEVIDDSGARFTPTPLGRDAKIAFVFPGAGNAYPGMGRELMLRFPDVLDALDAESRRLADQFMPRWLTPQRSDWSENWSSDAERLIRDDMLRVIFGQVSFCLFMHDLLRSFGFSPSAVIGYSLGESAGLVATRAWRDRDELLSRLRRSSLFRTELASPFDALRRSWNIPASAPIDWRVVLVPRGPDAVRAAISAATAKHARLLIVNTPRECVLGGLRDDVARVVEALRCRAVPLEGVAAVHCDAAESVHGPYRELHLLETTPPPDLIYYSGYRAASYEVTRESAADAITNHAVHGFDFAATIERAYADGVRAFIETGPQASCTRMIRRILEGRPHFAQSADDGLESESTRMLHLLAALIVQRIPVDLAPLSTHVTDCSTKPPTPEATRVTVPIRSHRYGEVSLRPKEPARVDSTIRLQSSAVPAEPSTPESVHPPVVATPSADPESDFDGLAVFADDMNFPPRDPADEVLECADSTADLDALAFDSDAIDLPAEGSLAAAVSDLAALSAQAHAAFLEFSQAAAQSLSRLVEYQRTLAQHFGAAAPLVRETVLAPSPAGIVSGDSPQSKIQNPKSKIPTPAVPFLDRTKCLEFARGRIGPVLGPGFVEIDAYPTRVRLPDEPLMLCDRIMSVEGEPRSLTRGKLITEHDVLPDAWYLDGGRAPVCVSVEAGQADLFLSAWLGIDFVTRGVRMYRLLDATVEFHRDLPRPGETLRYEIEIERFIRQGDTWMFAFNFKGTIDGRPMLTMTGGRAGFFTNDEIRNGPGLVLRDDESRPTIWRRPEKWDDLIRDSVSFRIGELLPVAGESLDANALDALRAGDLVACFGPHFADLPLRDPLRIPGGRMRLIDRVLEIDPTGGRFGNGTIRAEADVHPDDWFLTCHFIDDQTMPGTLMYECCVHTLRVLLLRAGWIGERCGESRELHHAGASLSEDESPAPVCYQPIPGIPAKLRCRGPVTPATKKVIYQVDIKELGYARFAADRSLEPFVVADALMFADGKRVVSFTDMTLRVTGLTKGGIERHWKTNDSAKEQCSTNVGRAVPANTPKSRDEGAQSKIQNPKSKIASEPSVAPIGDTPLSLARKPALFDTDRILAFAVGKPSVAFGEPYRIFDQGRRIARLPGPPFQFLDRITEIHAPAWELRPGGWIESQYDVPRDAWYFAANRQPTMPFSVILEAALQPCGWLAAYLGSALHGGDHDLSFRNLGGTATLFEEIPHDSGTLTCRVRITDVSKAGGMIIEKFDTQLYRAGRLVYDCKTTFGFFSAAALAQQIGIRDAANRRYIPTPDEEASGKRWQLPDDRPHTPEEAATLARRQHRENEPLPRSGRDAANPKSKIQNQKLAAAVPARAYRMLDSIDLYLPAGGPHGLGYILGTTRVDSAAWFFKAHFHQDPVWPGSLGLESFIQLLKIFAARRVPNAARSASPGGAESNSKSHSRGSHSKPHSRASRKPAPPRFEPIELHRPHTWTYRGQIIPTNQRVTVEAAITNIDDATRTLRASGFLLVDGVPIYELMDFGVRTSNLE